MTRTGAIVLDGGERLRRAVAALPVAEREESARRLDPDPGRARETIYRDWLERGVPPTVARWLRLLAGAVGDRRLFVATAGDGRRRDARGEGR